MIQIVKAVTLVNTHPKRTKLVVQTVRLVQISQPQRVHRLVRDALPLLARNMCLPPVPRMRIHNWVIVTKLAQANTKKINVPKVLLVVWVMPVQYSHVVIIVPPVKSKPTVPKVHGIQLGRIGRALTVPLIHIQHRVIRHVPLVMPIRSQRQVLHLVKIVMLVKAHHQDKPVVIALLVKPQHQEVHVPIVTPIHTRQQVMHLVKIVLPVKRHPQALVHVVIALLVKLRHQVMHVATVVPTNTQQQEMRHVPTVMLANTQRQALVHVVIVLVVKPQQRVVHVLVVMLVRTQRQVILHVPLVRTGNTQQQALLVVLPTHHVMPTVCQELVPQQQVRARLVLVTRGLLKIQTIAKPILLPVNLVNTYQNLEQLQLILHVPLVQHVAVLNMLVAAVPVRQIPPVLNDVLTEQVMLLRLPVLRLLVHVMITR